jgi:uncharacterized damage-inducible protein DinB
MLHSGYHRGQLVSHLKGKMQELPVTDLLFLPEKRPESKVAIDI